MARQLASLRRSWPLTEADGCETQDDVNDVPNGLNHRILVSTGAAPGFLCCIVVMSVGLRGRFFGSCLKQASTAALFTHTYREVTLNNVFFLCRFSLRRNKGESSEW